jgi:hypothetical protein
MPEAITNKQTTTTDKNKLTNFVWNTVSAASVSLRRKQSQTNKQQQTIIVKYCVRCIGILMPEAITKQTNKQQQTQQTNKQTKQTNKQTQLT